MALLYIKKLVHCAQTQWFCTLSLLQLFLKKIFFFFAWILANIYELYIVKCVVDRYHQLAKIESKFRMFTSLGHKKT